MAQIRMCNRDGRMFGTSEEGWSEWRGTIHGRYDDGTIRDVAEQFDFCPECTLTMTTIRPKAEVKMLTAAENAQERGYDPDYVKWLERQTSEPIQAELEDLDDKVHLCDMPTQLGGSVRRCTLRAGHEGVHLAK